MTQQNNSQRSYYTSEKINPPVYMSMSGGFFRVIVQGMPICNDKETEDEALAAARQMKVQPSSQFAWNGDVGLWFNPNYDFSSIPPCV